MGPSKVIPATQKWNKRRQKAGVNLLTSFDLQIRGRETAGLKAVKTKYYDVVLGRRRERESGNDFQDFPRSHP
jgi:hypothetical protein